MHVHRMQQSIETGTIYVLRAELDQLRLPFEDFVAATTANEHARAARFVHEADRRRHLIGRGLLRLFLAPRLGCAPAELPIQVSDLGKPYLEKGPSFNISHSGNIVLVALTSEGRIGVDVEAIRPIRDLPRLARTTFVEDEVGRVLQFGEADRLRPFFRVWARKEAILKALGLGLTALNDISVSCDVDCANALIRLDRTGECHHNWSIRPISCGADVEAAVAWDRPIRHIALLDTLV